MYIYAGEQQVHAVLGALCVLVEHGVPKGKSGADALAVRRWEGGVVVLRFLVPCLRQLVRRGGSPQLALPPMLLPPELSAIAYRHGVRQLRLRPGKVTQTMSVRVSIGAACAKAGRQTQHRGVSGAQSVPDAGAVRRSRAAGRSGPRGAAGQRAGRPHALAGG